MRVIHYTFALVERGTGGKLISFGLGFEINVCNPRRFVKQFCIKFTSNTIQLWNLHFDEGNSMPLGNEPDI